MSSSHALTSTDFKQAAHNERPSESYDSRQSRKLRDQDIWEQGRIDSALNRTSAGVDHSVETEPYLIVPRRLPPLFVKGASSAASAAAPAPPSAPPAACAELWEAARTGSAAVARLRADEERTLHDRFWELQHSNSLLGRLVGQTDRRPSMTMDKQARQPQSQPPPMSSPPALVRLSLPIHAVATELLRVVAENQVTVLVGATGSGKTTQLCQMVGKQVGGLVGVTQPRRVAAVSVATRVAAECGEKTVGKKVGYAIRFEDKTSGETEIKFMTDGVLLREALLDGELSKYKCIILDEAHERSLNTDILLGLLKRLVMRRHGRNDLKVIVTSATMNVEKFSKFFNNCATFSIPGRTFPVEVMYARSRVTDYVQTAVQQVLAILSQPESARVSRHTLVFLPGQEDIEGCCVLLQEALVRRDEENDVSAGERSIVGRYVVLPLYAQLSGEQQQKVFGAVEPGVSRIIVATNIAETSVTLDVDYVVDAGLNKVKMYNSELQMDQLVTCPITQANAQQRTGRAGRTSAGVCYRLYREETWREMEENIVPEIQRSNLANTVLLLLAMGVRDIAKFDFIDPPDKAGVDNALHLLYLLGAVDREGDITDKGTEMANYPLDPLLSNMVVEGARDNVQREMIGIVAMLNVPGVLCKTDDNKQTNQHDKFQIPESDHLTLLNIYVQFEMLNEQSRPQWCARNGLSLKALRKVQDVHQQLEDIAKTNVTATNTGSSDTWAKVREVLVRSLSVNLCKMKSFNEYIHLLNSTSAFLLAESALYNSTPPFIVYQDVMKTSKSFMHTLTLADPRWVDGRLFIVRPASRAAEIVLEQARDAALHHEGPTTDIGGPASQKSLRPAGVPNQLVGKRHGGGRAPQETTSSASPLEGLMDAKEEEEQAPRKKQRIRKLV